MRRILCPDPDCEDGVRRVAVCTWPWAPPEPEPCARCEGNGYLDEVACANCPEIECSDFAHECAADYYLCRACQLFPDLHLAGCEGAPEDRVEIVRAAMGG